MKTKTVPPHIDFLRRVYHPDLDAPGRTFGELGEPWQYDTIVNPFFSTRIDRMFVEMPRDWDKTGLVSACAFTRAAWEDNVIIRFYAADRDQAKIAFDAIRRRIIAHNKSMISSGEVVVTGHEIRFRDSNSLLVVESADDQSAFGKHQDVAVLDELHCWRKKAHENLFDSIVTKGRTKIVILTNPGARRAGLCWDTREGYRQEHERNQRGRHFFYTARENPFLPSWLDEREIKSRKVPPNVYRRLHLCQWGEGGELFSPEAVNACKVDRSYVDLWRGPGAVGGCDLGVKRDWAAYSICAGSKDGVDLIHKKIWKPHEQRNREVRVADVEKYIEDSITTFNLDKAAIERWQMISTIQALRSRVGGDCEIIDWSPTAQSVVDISMNIYHLITDGRFRFPADDRELEREILNAEEEEARTTDKEGFKIVFRRDRDSGHGDVFRSLAIAASYCTQEQPRREFDAIVGDVLIGNRMDSAGDDDDMGDYVDDYGDMDDLIVS